MPSSPNSRLSDQPDVEMPAVARIDMGQGGVPDMTDMAQMEMPDTMPVAAPSEIEDMPLPPVDNLPDLNALPELDDLPDLADLPDLGDLPEIKSA